MPKVERANIFYAFPCRKADGPIRGGKKDKMIAPRALRIIWKLIPFVLPLAVPLNCNANAGSGRTPRPETACGLNQGPVVTTCTADVTKDSSCPAVDLQFIGNVIRSGVCVRA